METDETVTVRFTDAEKGTEGRDEPIEDLVEPYLRFWDSELGYWINAKLNGGRPSRRDIEEFLGDYTDKERIEFLQEVEDNAASK